MGGNTGSLVVAEPVGGSRGPCVDPEDQWRGGGKASRAIPPQVLSDMRWVYEHPDEGKDKPRHKAVRELLKLDSKTFMTQFIGLEKAWAGLKERAVRGEESVVEVEVSPDEGTARCLEVLGEWLTNWEAKR